MSVKQRRAFKRDAYLGIRLPEEDKRRLEELARRHRRDVSSFALQFICEGTQRVEKEMRSNPLFAIAN